MNLLNLNPLISTSLTLVLISNVAISILQLTKLQELKLLSSSKLNFREFTTVLSYLLAVTIIGTFTAIPVILLTLLVSCLIPLTNAIDDIRHKYARLAQQQKPQHKPQQQKLQQQKSQHNDELRAELGPMPFQAGDVVNQRGTAEKLFQEGLLVTKVWYDYQETLWKLDVYREDPLISYTGKASDFYPFGLESTADLRRKAQRL